MSSQQGKPLKWGRCRGRNGWDSAIDVPEDMGTEALNWHFYAGGLGSKRGGSLSTGTLTGLSGLNALYSWVPGQNEAARELFAVDDSATNKFARMAAGSTFSVLTVGDGVDPASDKEISFAALNGKLFIAYDSGTSYNRLKVYDPGLSTTDLRWAGMGTPVAPTGADDGAGGLTLSRSYKVAFTEQRSSVTVRRGELSPALTRSITAKLGSTITKPATLSSSETHWELYASDTATGTYYLMATTVVGTTTYDDQASAITTTTAAPTAGENTPFPSVKFLYSDGKTLFGLGVWETAAQDSHTPQAGTVYYTPALDTSTVYDDERCRNTATAVGRLILGRNAGGVDRGIGGLGNLIYAFQSKGIYQLTPTESPDVRFRRTQIDDQLGAVTHDSIRKFIDQNGKPALYFLDPTWGPYRFGDRGLEWVGKDVKDLWDTVNLAATNKVAWAQPIPELGGILFAFASSSANDPDVGLFFDPTKAQYDEQGLLRGGWTKWTGSIVAARCATLMSATLGATMSRTLTLYVGASSGTTLLKYSAVSTDDNGTDFQGYVQSKAWEVEPLFHNKSVLRSYLLSTVSSGITLTQTLIRNFGDDTNRTSAALLTAAGSESRTLKKFEDAALAEAFTFQVRLGDAAAQDSTYTLDRWYGQIELKGER